MKNIRWYILTIFLFTVSLFFTSNSFADSYVTTGNEIIKKIYRDISLLKTEFKSLEGFGDEAINKRHKQEILSITYGDPWKKNNSQEKLYIAISYANSPVTFKLWEYVPTIFYSLNKDLYVGCVILAEPKLRAEIIRVIEEDIK